MKFLHEQMQPQWLKKLEISDFESSKFSVGRFLRLFLLFLADVIQRFKEKGKLRNNNKTL